MNTNSNFTNESVIPVFIHSDYATFEWSRAFIECLYRYAKLQGFDIRIFDQLHDILQLNPRVLIVCGVDRTWIDSVLQTLSPMRVSVILLYAMPNEPRDRVSLVHYDQTQAIKIGLDHLKDRGRLRPALFGIQANDLSDLTKAATFLQSHASEDVYYITNDIETCFDQFLSHVERYDSVICSNDLFAVYLMSHLNRYKITIPQQLHLVGSGNLWISSHVTPRLTTFFPRQEPAVAYTIQLYHNLLTFSELSSVQAFLVPDLLERESTGCSTRFSDLNPPPKYFQYSEIIHVGDIFKQYPEIYKIKALDQVLSSLTMTDLIILQRLADGISYSDISDEVYLTVDTVKYHIQKVYRLLGIHKRHELKMLLEQYSLQLI